MKIVAPTFRLFHSLYYALENISTWIYLLWIRMEINWYMNYALCVILVEALIQMGSVLILISPFSSPPYAQLPYIPPYSPSQPFGPGGQFQIDPVTGIISGTPQTEGLFSVGICVKEYRNGQLLNTTIRDIMFHVTECSSYADAEIASDITLAEDHVRDQFLHTSRCRLPISV